MREGRVLCLLAAHPKVARTLRVPDIAKGLVKSLNPMIVLPQVAPLLRVVDPARPHHPDLVIAGPIHRLLKVADTRKGTDQEVQRKFDELSLAV